MSPIAFSCTQRLMTPISPGIQKKGRFLESRVCALAASFFLLLDAGFHLLAGAIKGFAWTRNRILDKTTPNDYYPHFVKALSCASLIPFGTAIGMICPSAFQSKKLQEYLGWKIIHTRDQKSQTENIEASFHVDPSFPAIHQGDNLSTSEDLEFEDALENLDITDQLACEDIQLLKTQLQAAKKEITEITPKLNLLYKILLPLKDCYPYNQVLVMQKLIHKSIIDAPTIYSYTSDLMQEKLNEDFQNAFKMDFCEFCTQENPDINSASQVLTNLLNTYHFYAFAHPVEAAISTAIDTLFIII